MPPLGPTPYTRHDPPAPHGPAPTASQHKTHQGDKVRPQSASLAIDVVPAMGEVDWLWPKDEKGCAVPVSRGGCVGASVAAPLAAPPRPPGSHPSNTCNTHTEE